MRITVVMRTVLFSGALAMAGCSSMMMRVADAPGSNAQVVLAQGDKVAVAKPELDPNLVQYVEKAEFTKDSFEEFLRKAVVEALKKQGIEATAAEEGTHVVRIQVTEYVRGAGAARAFGVGGDSNLGGTVVVATPSGERKLDVTKRGSKSGVASAKDQSRENLEYFANAVAKKISG